MKSDSINIPQTFRNILGLLSQLKEDVVIFLFLMASLVITLAVSAYSRRPKANEYRPTVEATSIQPLPLAAPARGQTEGLQVELVTIHPYGFEPEELTLAKGRFLLAIDNRSHLDEVSVQLLSPGGAQGTMARAPVTRMPRGNMNWNRMVDLPPGEYLLTEENHPQWTCKITIGGK